MLFVSAPSAHACSACGCTLNSDWASQGLAASGGWRMDLRYDFFEQDQLRSGTESVSRSSFAFPADEEVQRYTINRNYTFALDYSPNKDWGFSAILPWFDRSHATIAEGDTGISTSHDEGISDLRLMASGPRTGFDEIRLPAVQPGSSIMPGKVNPSIPEMVNQVCFQVFGNDACVSVAAEHGQLELNVMMPVIAHNVLFSMMILTNSGRIFTEKTVKGIEANEEQCEYWLERSAALATALAPQIGYARAAELSKQSVKENVLIRDLVKREKVLPAKEIDEVLDLHKMTEIGVPGGKHGGVAGG